MAFYFLLEALEKIVVRWHVSSRQMELATGGG
jgi:hypothetical protein